MNVNNPDVTDEDIGRRTVEIRRARAVERAIELVRKGVGKGWAQFTTSDVEALRRGLGEAWGYMPHAEWERVSFTRLSLDDLKQIQETAALLDSGASTQGALETIAGYLRAAQL